MNSSEYIIQHVSDCYTTPPAPNYKDASGEDSRSDLDDNGNQSPLIRRFLVSNSDGQFHTAIVYIETVTPSGNSILRAAYHGHTYGSCYEEGYFIVDTSSGDHRLLSHEEVVYLPNADLFRLAMKTCCSFWDYPDYEGCLPLPEWNEKALGLLKQGEDGNFVDEEFNGDILVSVSLHWPLNFCFASREALLQKHPWPFTAEGNRMSE